MKKLLPIVFLLGAFSSLYNFHGASWVTAVVYKVKLYTGQLDSKGIGEKLHISTSRYEFEEVSREDGTVYQLATDGKEVFKIPRSGDVNKKQTLAEAKAPLVMGYHYFKGVIYRSIVLECYDGQYLSFQNQEKELFKTPCYPDTNNTVMWGGRITDDGKNLYLSIGEQRYDRSGYPKTKDIKRDETVFGKVLKFNPDFTYTVFTSGHRNPQGLFWDGVNMWETEHGANGGDELNILKEGKDYGWPNVMFGKPYPKLYPSGEYDVNQSKNPSTGVDLKLGHPTGTYEGYEPPVMSWTLKSGGIGQILRVPMNSPLKDWRGDILVSIMGQGSLHRLKLKNNVVIMDELIQLDKRVRDMVLLNSGELVLSFDEGSLVTLKIQ